MNKSQKTAVAVGAGVAAIAAAAAGIYFLTGKNAKNRKKVAKWADSMRKDVIKELKQAGKLSKSGYNQLIDEVSRNYQGLKNASGPELKALATELKGHWDAISKEVGSAARNVRKVVPKSVKSVAKKVQVKTAKKTARKK